jgi:hypothetical protein
MGECSELALTLGRQPRGLDRLEMDIHGDVAGLHPLWVLVPELCRNPAGIAFWSAVPPDLGRSSRGLAFSEIEAVKLITVFIRDEPCWLRRKFRAGTRRRPTLHHRFRQQADRTSLPAKGADCRHTSSVLSASCEPSRCRPRSSERTPST